MKTIILALPGNEILAKKLAEKLSFPIGKITARSFPDGESYIRIHDKVKAKKVILVCSLHQPDGKLLPLYFLSKIVKELGAKSIWLVAPYLAYMRQDKVFRKGEGITSQYFASLLSQFTDNLITVDPHLHRISNLNEIYSIPTKVVHAANHISQWILENVASPLLIGPDIESEQWVSMVAKNAHAPFIILSKKRRGDSEVKISIPKVKSFLHYTPVLVDDIISTARTMIETVGHLKNAGMKPPICIGVHAIFANQAFQKLLDSGIAKVVTCNTIPHESNAIDLSDLYLDFLKN